MKTWFDWMDEYYLPQPQPGGAQPGETERILALTRQKLGLTAAATAAPTRPGEAAPKHLRPGRVRRLWALAAAAALVFCLGVGTAAAAGVFPWASIGDFFGAGGQQQAASLGMPGEGLSLTQTKDGVTVTLEGILDDGATAYLPVQLTFADGQYDPDLRYHVLAALKPAAAAQDQISGCGSRPLRDANPADNTVPLMLTARHEALQPGDAVELVVSGIFGNAVHDDGGTETVWSWERELTFSFTLPEFPPVVTVDAPAGTAEPDTGVPIARITLAPMRVEVTFAEHPDDAAVRDALSRLPLSLTLADGSSLPLPEGWGADGGVRSAEGAVGYYTVGCEFDSLIDPASVASVTVNGVTIPVA